MKRTLSSVALLALVPLFTSSLFTSCLVAAAGAAAGAGFVVSQQVLPNNVHMAQVALDVEVVWPSVQETVSFYQEPGTEASVQDFPRSVKAKVRGAKVTVDVEAIDMDRTSIRVTAEKYLSKDNATASEVLNGILRRLEEHAEQQKK